MGHHLSVVVVSLEEPLCAPVQLANETAVFESVSAAVATANVSADLDTEVSADSTFAVVGGWDSAEGGAELPGDLVGRVMDAVKAVVTGACEVEVSVSSTYGLNLAGWTPGELFRYEIVLEDSVRLGGTRR